jgi:hypothetical protein
MFGHARRGLIGDPEAGGYCWQSRPVQPRQFSCWIVDRSGNSSFITPPQFSRNTRGRPHVPN